jgi:small basic protein
MTLRTVLFANAAFSLISALVLLAAARDLAEFTTVPRGIHIGVGIALLPWVAFVFANARRESPLERDTRLTIAGDLAWVVVAAAIILIPDSLSVGGKLALGTVSLAVLGFAVLQWRALQRAR